MNWKASLWKKAVLCSGCLATYISVSFADALLDSNFITNIHESNVYQSCLSDNYSYYSIYNTDNYSAQQF